MFPTMRDTLARTGGQLLVSVMRDMLAGKVRLRVIQDLTRLTHVVGHRTLGYLRSTTRTRRAHR